MVDKTESASPADETEKRETAAAADASTDRNDASSTSSGSDPAEKKEDKPPLTGIDITREVLGLDANNRPIDKEKSPPSPSEKEGSDTTPATAADDGKTPKDDAADKGDVLDQVEKSKFRDDPVFKKVTGELRDIRQERDGLTAKMQEQEPLIKFATEFRTTMEQTGITAEALGELVGIGALLVSDPRLARAKIKEVLDELDDQLGERLPDDLRRKVDAGDLDEADALEISRARADKKRNEAAAAAKREEAPKPKPAANDDEQRKKVAQAVSNAVNARISVIAGSDPEFSKKEEQLEREIHFLLSKTKLKSVDEAISLVNTAMANVNAFFAKTQPAPKDIKPINPSSSETTPNRKAADLPANASGLDVTRAALGLPLD